MSLEPAAVAAALPAYDIGAELGRGAWGIVLEGRHRQLRREVALKQLPPAFAADAEVRSRFVAEARLLGSLDHPHIVPVYDFVEREGLCLLVMEKLSGGTAWSRFVDEGLRVETACAIALVTAAALQYAHEQGVLHRDIKPDNLLFSGDGALLKVADFGIAKVLAGGRTMATSAGEILGTPAYMAPEQATGTEVTPSTDLYALGVTFYEMLSGRLPFEELDSPLAVLYQRVNESPIDLSTVAPDVPAALAPVVMRTLQTAPGDRFQTATAFAVALADAATAAFGRGWLERAGIRAVLGGRIAALTERETPRPTAPTNTERVHPRATVRGARPVVEPQPQDLVPVADLTPPGHHAALGQLRQLLSTSGQVDAQRLAREIERAESNAHELAELSLLKQLRSGAITLGAADRVEVERLLGAEGPTVTDRLGLPATATEPQVVAALNDAVAMWRRRQEGPLSSRGVREVARVVVRSCEGMLAARTSSPS